MKPYFTPQTGITDVSYGTCICATVEPIDPNVSGPYPLPDDLD